MPSLRGRPSLDLLWYRLPRLQDWRRRQFCRDEIFQRRSGPQLRTKLNTFKSLDVEAFGPRGNIVDSSPSAGEMECIYTVLRKPNPVVFEMRAHLGRH